jgi:hypothetical protein
MTTCRVACAEMALGRSKERTALHYFLRVLGRLAGANRRTTMPWSCFVLQDSVLQDFGVVYKTLLDKPHSDYIGLTNA